MNHQQENVGSHQKQTPHIQEQRISPSNTVGGAKSPLESNTIYTRDTWRAQKKPHAHQDPETPKRLSQTVFECHLQRYGSQWCDHQPRARHPGMQSQVGLRKYHYEQSGGDGIPVELCQILKDDAVKVLHSICQQIWKTQQWPQTWKRSDFIPIPKKGKAQKMLKLPYKFTHLTL